MDFCDNNTLEEYFPTPKPTNETIDGFKEIIILQKSLYKHFIPILIIGCVISVVLNSLLVIVGHTKTNNKSPILVLSLNLATTDCLASIFIATGLLVNSYLPVVFEINMGQSHCNLLILEIFRLSAIISSAMHLLSLALVHYRGIVKPLHYRAVIFCSQHRTRSIHLMSFICWSLPALFFGIYFVSIPCQGFLTPECKVQFILTHRFRLIILILFFIPLLLMLFLYVRIFTIIKSHQQQRSHPGSIRQFSRNNSTQRHESFMVQTMVNNKKPLFASLRLCISCSKGDSSSLNGHTNGHSYDKNIELSDNEPSVSSVRKSIHLSIRSRSSSTNTKYCFRPQQQVHSHTKALTTTLLILGTYLICWMPAVIFFALTCVDICPLPITQMNMKLRIIFSFITNGLVILKAIVDPFIYTYRMKEMKIAINRYCLRRPVHRTSTMNSQRSGTMTAIRTGSPSQRRSVRQQHIQQIAETNIQ